MAQNLVSKVCLMNTRVRLFIAKEILRSIETLDSSTKCMWTAIFSNWETAWHGTKSCSLQSIVRSGLLLMPSGTKLQLIKPPKTHYQLGDKHFATGLRLYSSHQAYFRHANAERIFSEETQWCVVVKGRVKPLFYK